MTTDHLLARLAAANPVPAPARVRAARAAPFPRGRVRLAAILLAAAVCVPAVAFADNIGALLGIANQGTTVPVRETPFSGYPKLSAAMHELGLTTMQLLGKRDKISFYAARNPAGHFCFAVASARAIGIGCFLHNEFPSPQQPLIDLFSGPKQISGFASDRVAEVALLDSRGETVATIPPSHNIYALSSPPADATAIEALDASGHVLYRHPFPRRA